MAKRGKQEEKVIRKRLFIDVEEIGKIIPEFIEEHYPKGIDKRRGFATVVASQLYCYLLGLSKSK